MIVRALPAYAVLLLALYELPARAQETRSEATTSFVTAAPPHAWTGVYLGGHIGYAWGQSDWTAVGNGQSASGTFSVYQPFDLAAGTGSYFSGLQVGYNKRLSSGVLIGVESDVSFPNSIVGTSIVSAPAIGQAQ